MNLKFYAMLLSLLLPISAFSQSINIRDAYIRPQIMSSTDGTGGITTTYFHFYGNQLDKINENFKAHESYTILGRKQLNAVYYTIKGNNRGKIYNLIIRSTKNSRNQVANELIFESPGEVKETYLGF
jgi:hypothetical protein